MSLPPIKELCQICQKGKFERSWYAKHFTRKISIYFTWLFLHTKISANQISLLEILISWTGVLLLIFLGLPGILPAVILFQLGYVFDCVDGEIARFKKQSSLLGIFHDSLGHVLVTPSLFWGMAFFYYFQTNSLILVYIAAITSIFVISPIKHAKMRALYLATSSQKPFHQIKSQSNQNSKNIEEPLFYEEKNSRQKLLHLSKSMTQLPNDLNLFCLSLLIMAIFRTPIFILIVFCFFAAIIIFKELYLYYKINKDNQLNQEYLRIKSKYS